MARNLLRTDITKFATWVKSTSKLCGDCTYVNVYVVQGKLTES